MENQKNENEEKRNYFEEICLNNHSFLKEFIKMNYNIRNNYLLFYYSFISNNRETLDEANNKLRENIKQLDLHIQNYFEFSKRFKYEIELKKEDFQNFFEYEYSLFKNINLINEMQSYYLLHLFGFKDKKINSQFESEVYQNIVNSFKKLFKNYLFKKEYFEVKVKIEEFLKNIINYLKKSKANLHLEYTFEETMNNKINVKISFCVGNLFILHLIYYDYDNNRNIFLKKKLFLGGKKEHFPFNQNSYLQRKKFIPDSYSKFLIYKKLKIILLEKLDGFIVLKENLMKGIKDTIISPIMELLFFSNFLYGYINIFNQKCFICQKITKYNKIDKVFYPPLILLLPYNKFCHEDCYIFHTNN